MNDEPHKLDTEFQQPWKDLPEDDQDELASLHAGAIWLALSAASSLLAVAFGAWLYTLLT